MGGSTTDMMRDIGAAARAAAGELAYASAERKHAALIGAAQAVWAAREANSARSVSVCGPSRRTATPMSAFSAWADHTS